MNDIPEPVTDALDGEQFEPHPVCDACNKEFKIGDTAILYITDVILGVDHTRLDTPAVVSMFCSSPPCANGRIESLPIPWVEAAEALVEAEIDAGWVIGHQQDILDFSPREDGIDWNPLEVPEAFVGQAAPVFLQTAGRQVKYGPQDMVITLYHHGVDPSRYIRADGEFDVPDDEIEEMRARTLKEMIGNAGMTEQFSDLSEEQVLKIAQQNLREQGITKYSDSV